MQPCWSNIEDTAGMLLSCSLAMHRPDVQQAGMGGMGWGGAGRFACEEGLHICLDEQSSLFIVYNLKWQ